MRPLQTATEYAIMAACALIAYRCGAEVWIGIIGPWRASLELIAQLGALGR